MTVTDATPEVGRTRIQRRFYADGGEKQPRVHAQARFIDWVFVKLGGQTLTLDMDGLDPDVVRCAALFGLSTAVGNAAGQIKGEADAFEAVSARIETLQEGQWASDARTGPRTKDLVEAWARLVGEKGINATETWREARRADILEGRQTHDSLLGNKRFAMHYEAIKFERAQAAMQAAQNAAGLEAGIESDDLVVT